MERESSPFSLSSFFSLDQKQLIVLLTILFILVAGGLYFFIYVPSNQKAVEALRFRAIQNIDNNIHNKVDNSVILMNQLIEASNAKISKDGFDSTHVREYIDSFPTKNFKLLPIEKVELGLGDLDSMSQVKFQGNKVKVILQKKERSLRMEYSLNQFVKPLLPVEVFDQYLLLDDNGKVIYQTFPSGISQLDRDSLQTKRTPFTQNTVKDIRLSGTEYKMFLQQVHFSDTSYITIAGLLAKNKYQHLKTSLPETMVMLMLFIVIATILSFPWIKLYHIGNQDRLTVFDGLFAFAGSMLLMAFLIFGFINYNVSMRPGEDPSLTSKRNLAEGLKKAYIKEIELACNTLQKVDQLRIKLSLTGNLVNINETIQYQWQNGPNAQKNTNELNKKIPPIINTLKPIEIFWLNTNGGEVQNFNSSKNAPAGNYENRNYYKQLHEDKPYYLSKNKGRKIGLEQVVSWTTGSFITVVSIPLEKPEGPDTAAYGAIAFGPKSIDKPLLPAGFTFAIVDEMGKVLYHSNTFKNLNENLLAEFSEKDRLAELLLDNVNASFETKYGGREYDVYVSSFSDLPYHIVIFEDKAFASIRDIKVFLFTFSLLLFFFVFLGIQFLVVFLFYQRPSFFKKHYFDISWLGPDRSLKSQYLLVIGFNLFIIAILFFVSFIASFLQFLFILLLSSTAVTIYLNSQYKRSYFGIDDDKFRQKGKAIKTLWGIVILINCAAVFAIDLLPFLIVELVIAAFAWSYSKYMAQPRNIQAIRKFVQGFSVSHSFSIMVFTRLIIISAIPVIFFFISAYNYESSLIGVYRHSQFIDDRIAGGNENHFVKEVNLFYDGIWVTEPNAKPNKAKSENLPEWLFWKLTRYSSSDSTKFYRKSKHQAIHTQYEGGLTVTEFDGFGQRPFQLATATVNYKFPAIIDGRKIDWRGATYWLLLSGALFLFLFILHRIIRKLFALNLPLQTGWKEIDEKLLSDNSLNFRLFVIGPPGASIMERIKGGIKDNTIRGANDEELFFDRNDAWLNNAYIADMLMIPDNDNEALTDPEWKAIKENALKKRYKLIIVNHFEYDLHNYNTNRIKLNFLETLKQRRDCKIIIASTVHPTNFLESLNQSENKKPVGQRQPEHDLERWHVLLCHFRIMVKGITDSNHQIEVINGKVPIIDPGWEESLKAETRYGRFLHEMQKPISEALTGLLPEEKQRLKGDPLAFKLEITSHYYYMSLWQSLTKEEKFLLYDLAEDGLVNPYDDYNLTLLISKGLIIQADCGLRLFNKGFRNFILTSIGASEAMKIRNQIRDNGTWNSLRIPLIILIVAVFAFLFASQQEAYETVLKYLSVLTISVPTALKFFAMFEKTPKSN